MKKFATALAFSIIGSITYSAPATAGTAGDALSNCMADNTTGKDRKDLAQWIFVAMTAHPEIKPFSNVTDENRDDLDKKLAVLATKLMTENCKAETKTAMQTEGSAAIEAAFGALGKLAMQELMSNQAVNASFSRYVKYLDKTKFESILSTN